VIDETEMQEALALASPAEKIELLRLVEEIEKRKTRDTAQGDFLFFVKTQWPDFIEGAHHRRIAKLFNDIAEGKKKRIIINLAPRHTKSEFASYLFPAWFLGKFPKKKIMQVSNTGELAEGFGRKVRNLLDTEEYRSIFPEVELRSDSKAAGRWNTNYNGEYYACGIGAALAGRGADIAIIDDPHTEAEALTAIFNPGVYDKVYDWYTSGVRQRLQPGGAIIIVQTRWSLRDLTGQILENSQNKKGTDQWEVFEFPAIMPSGKSLWPEFWSIKELEAIKAELPAGKWQAQYQQNPTSDETAIIKRDMWNTWKKDKPPKCEYTLMSFDCAFEAKQTADYSAMTLWGVWYNEEEMEECVILLDAWRGKLEFPELKAKALELYKEHEPDSVIIEKKASGGPLIYELRKMGIPVQEFTPSRGNDKIARLNAIVDVFASGKVWAPDRRWAEDVIEEVASFPNGRHDDYTDTCFVAGTLVLMGDGAEKPIEHIKPGEEVMTPVGPRRVLDAGSTGAHYTYSIAGIEGTAGHPVFTNRGWIGLNWLKPNDKILTLSTRTGDVWHKDKTESLYDSTVSYIKSIVTDLILSAWVGGICFTEMCGNFIKGIFQKALMSTTSTGTPATTLSRIWRCYLQKSIERNINHKFRNDQEHQSIWPIWIRFALWLQNGINQKKVGHGTESIREIAYISPELQKLTVKSYQWKKSVMYAERTSYLKTLNANTPALNSAIRASKIYNEQFLVGTIPKSEIARIVAKHLSPFTPIRSFALPNVSKITEMPRANAGGKKEVFNLMVEECPMYYANGVLVHNCSQAINRIRKGGMVRTKHDEDDEADSWRYRKLAAYY
jgi:predicted phage terminase large subunit-like protein